MTVSVWAISMTKTSPLVMQAYLIDITYKAARPLGGMVVVWVIRKLMKMILTVDGSLVLLNMG